MNSQFAATLVVAVISSIGGWVALFLNGRQTRRQRDREDLEREREERAKEAERRRAQQAEDSQTWYRESRENYDIAKREASEAKQECATCMQELRATRQAIYRLLEDLEEQIIPMLMFADADLREVRVAMRSAVQRARESL